MNERCLQIRVLISEGEMGARVALGVGNCVLFREVSSLSQKKMELAIDDE